MTEQQREACELEIQQFRYSIIAELQNPFLRRGEIRKLIKEKAAREYDIPNTSRRRLSVSCIQKWLQAYKQFGMSGLLPKRRNDTGACKSLQVEEKQALSEQARAATRADRHRRAAHVAERRTDQLPPIKLLAVTSGARRRTPA